MKRIAIVLLFTATLGSVINVCKAVTDPYYGVLPPSKFSMFKYDFIYYDKDSIPIGYNITSESMKEVAFNLPLKANGKVLYDTDVPNLGTIRVPESVTHEGVTYKVTAIGHQAFTYFKIDSVYIPETVVKYEDYAFYQCWINTLIIDGKMDTVPDYCFTGSSIYKHVKFPETTKYIGERAFCRFEFPDDTRWPNSATFIGKKAFDHTTLTDVNFASNAECLGEQAFGYTSITTFEFPPKVSCVPSYLCTTCKLLLNVTLHEKVDTIQVYAFSSCGKLESVTCLNPEPPIAETNYGEDPFKPWTSKLYLYVPSKSIEKYKTAPVWKDFGHICAIETENEPTSITPTNQQPGKEAEIYDLNGIRIGCAEDIDKLPRGLYIKGGKKYYKQ